MPKFNPPGHRYGKQKVADEYPDVVGELARAKRGLPAPSVKRKRDTYPNMLGTEEQRRAGDRAVAKHKWKPPVDRPPRPARNDVPRIVVEGRYEDPKKEIRVPKVMNPDGSEWKPPVDKIKPQAPRDKYPQIVGMVGIGREKKYRPPRPEADWNYRVAKTSVDEQYIANCLGLTGEGLRTVLSYDPVIGELTWLRGSGPRTGQTVPHNVECTVWFKGLRRNVYGIIYLMVLGRLPDGWVYPANGAANDWSWDNIKPTAQNPC